MHPELEIFLERVFERLRPSSEEIGRIVVEPDYEIEPVQRDEGHLVSELMQCLREQRLDAVALAMREGVEIEIPAAYRLLAKYIRRITLHGDKVEGPWVEVEPPGNWI